MPKFAKGSQEAKDYMKSIREKRTTNSQIKYETAKGKTSHKNITVDLEKDTENLPNGDKIVKTVSKTKGSKAKKNTEIIQPLNADPVQLVIAEKEKGKGRPKKYASAEEAKEAKKQQTLASNKKKLAEKKAISGGKIDIGKSFTDMINPVKKITEAVEYGKAIIYGREDYPPKVRTILGKVGGQKVKSITIKRTPVSGLLTGALSVFSLGKFGKRLEKGFDELFHLFIEITTEQGHIVSLEKNEVINMELSPKNRAKTEIKIVSQTIPHLTIDEMLANTEKYMGKKRFFGYSANDNNCQDFIHSFFKSNNIGDESDWAFIKQDTKSLFKNLPALRKLSNTLTDIGASVDVITQGTGVLNTYDALLKHLTSHIADPKEPIDPRDFKQSKMLINSIMKQKKAEMKRTIKGTGGDTKKDWVFTGTHKDINQYNRNHYLAIKNRQPQKNYGKSTTEEEIAITIAELEEEISNDLDDGKYISAQYHPKYGELVASIRILDSLNRPIIEARHNDFVMRTFKENLKKMSERTGVDSETGQKLLTSGDTKPQRPEGWGDNDVGERYYWNNRQYVVMPNGQEDKPIDELTEEEDQMIFGEGNIYGNGIKILKKIKNKILTDNIAMSNGRLNIHHFHHMVHSIKKGDQGDSDEGDADSNDGSDDGFHQMRGGDLFGIGKSFKKAGKDIKNVGKDIKKDASKVIKPISKDVSSVGKYVVSKKGGLASDLITYGIPSATGAILGSLGTAVGGPGLGVLASAAGTKIGNEYIAPAVHKSSGAGVRQPRFTKGSQEAKDHMAKIRGMKGGAIRGNPLLTGVSGNPMISGNPLLTGVIKNLPTGFKGYGCVRY